MINTVRKNKDKCPLNGQCLLKNIVYQATVTANKKNTGNKTLHWHLEHYLQGKASKPQQYLFVRREKNKNFTSHIYMGTKERQSTLQDHMESINQSPYLLQSKCHVPSLLTGKNSNLPIQTEKLAT